MVLLAPKQGTYQLEQQLLAGSALGGYTRLSILSFESLAHFVLDHFGRSRPTLLTEVGRVMVLRSLLAKERHKLKVFRASARLTGFAQELSNVITEAQQAGFDATSLLRAAAEIRDAEGLRRKLEDIATLLSAYETWLRAHSLQDYEALLKDSANLLATSGATGFRLASLWVDGFAEFSDQELDVLAKVIPYCEQTTITFCLERLPAREQSWLSHWWVTERAVRRCQARIGSIPGIKLRLESLSGSSSAHRFSTSPALSYLQQSWDSAKAFEGDKAVVKSAAEAVALRACQHPEAEITTAAREILRFVRAGGRYREAAVLVRDLDRYHDLFQRVFTRYGIPFFLDRRESVAHHPLAELTRSALRIVAFDWRHEDWFAALKTGLVPAAEHDIDLLENEALARGWKGKTWLRTIELKDVPKNQKDGERIANLAVQLEQIRQKVVPPFERFASALMSAGNRPTGPELADALRWFWQTLAVQDQLLSWSAGGFGQAGLARASSIHETVWRHLESWIENAALAFAQDSLPLREWLPILEAGLASLTVGVIPPALDQVLIGAVDRSRTPEVKLGLVVGLNEGVFPGRPPTGRLLSEADHLELEKHQIALGAGMRRYLGRERYLGYIACTRARERLVLSWSTSDATGAPLNRSAYVSHIRQLFPQLPIETPSAHLDLPNILHRVEWMDWLLRRRANGREPMPALAEVAEPTAWPGITVSCPQGGAENGLSPELAAELHGTVLRSSVSRIEQFAACPFRFFVNSGLRAEERKRFELDSKEQGNFQHDVLAMFHQTLREQNKRWRDVTPGEARAFVGRIAASLLASFRQGLLQADDRARFTAQVLTESLQDFVEVLVSWMREQYQFDPIDVELPFGVDDVNTAWRLELANGKRLEIYGRIDRVDVFHDRNGDRALCVVVDYKSSHKQLDGLLMQNGLQLQLLTYLNVLRQWPRAKETFGVSRLEPAGVFYVNLRGRYPRGRNRQEALSDPQNARRLAYRHFGRFDLGALPFLDSRNEVRQGDQFNYRLKQDGQLHGGSREALTPELFKALLEQSEDILREMAHRIFSGSAEVGPYRRGSVTACDQCLYQAICRIDPWTHSFRSLSLRETAKDAGTE